MRVFFTFLALAGSAAGKEAWESVDLERAVMGSKVVELTAENLPQMARENPLMVVWFYAPWCKQCKLIRDAYEEASNIGVEGVVFGRIDCVKFPDVKKQMSVFSYPTLKVFRGERHRFLPLPKQRTTQMIVASIAAEAAMATGFRLLDDEAELRSAIFNQREERMGPADDVMHFAGVGEAAVVAHLGSADGEAARAFATLAAGTDIRHSPTVFVATTRAELLSAIGLSGERVPVDHVAVLQLETTDDGASSGGSGSGSSGGSSGGDSFVPEAGRNFHVRPLLASSGFAGGAARAAAGAASAAERQARAAMAALASADLEKWVVGRRVAPVVDFTAHYSWGKRAASLTHVHVHGLLFFTNAQASEPPCTRRTLRAHASTLSSPLCCHYTRTPVPPPLPTPLPTPLTRSHTLSHAPAAQAHVVDAVRKTAALFPPGEIVFLTFNASIGESGRPEMPQMDPAGIMKK